MFSFFWFGVVCDYCLGWDLLGGVANGPIGGGGGWVPHIGGRDGDKVSVESFYLLETSCVGEGIQEDPIGST